MRAMGMSERFAVGLAVGGVAVVAVLTGCSSTVGGNATEEGSSPVSHNESVPLFNPCTDLSDEVLRGDKLDPATKQVTLDRGPDDDSWWKICNWRSTEGPYAVTVFSTRRTLPERRANEESLILGDVAVGSRNGVTNTRKDDPDNLTCYVSIPASQGMFEVGISWRYSERQSMPQSPPCELAARHMRYFEPLLPK
ncbi:Protein of unknown function (DUF3558) [Nocardia amikacinitolerans]|uniref:DUF3558 domain-containing protein n=1 Tax=Nocardia amikacinitolerans TaxID=756689 RepID=UPI0020A4AE25|nr:DUF3558 domain-containing protein [Nocardia amikacinitolerans]MCP2299974.1 Protein of unknown function (DUF3558) [Nocardia amikacinitolerans]